MIKKTKRGKTKYDLKAFKDSTSSGVQRTSLACGCRLGNVLGLLRAASLRVLCVGVLGWTFEYHKTINIERTSALLVFTAIPPWSGPRGAPTYNALLTDRTLNKNGSFPPNCVSTFLAKAHGFY